jgi:hypothetical protein
MGWDSNHDQPPPSILKGEGRLWIVDLRKKPLSPLYPQHSNIIDTKISIPKQVIFIRLAILLPQNKMLPGRIVGAGAFDEGVENSIKFILHGLS